MAHIANTRKVFNYAIEINGVNQFECQGVEFPELSVEVVEHGDTNYSVKTPGRVKVGDIKIEKVKPMPGTDRWAWDWFNAGQDPFVGGGALAGNVKKMIVIRELDSSGLIILNSWVAEGCFINTLGQSKFDRMSSDNIIQNLSISVDRVRML